MERHPRSPAVRGGGARAWHAVGDCGEGRTARAPVAAWGQASSASWKRAASWRRAARPSTEATAAQRTASTACAARNDSTAPAPAPGPAPTRTQAAHKQESGLGNTKGGGRPA